jgi:integrase
VKLLARLEASIFPWLGDRPIRDIKPPELLSVLRRVESRGVLETAHRLMNYCGNIYRYAVATGRAERDISSDLRGALPPSTPQHHASVTDPEGVAALLRAIDAAWSNATSRMPGSPQTRRRVRWMICSATRSPTASRWAQGRDRSSLRCRRLRLDCRDWKLSRTVPPERAGSPCTPA